MVNHSGTLNRKCISRILKDLYILGMLLETFGNKYGSVTLTNKMDQLSGCMLNCKVTRMTRHGIKNNGGSIFGHDFTCFWPLNG